MCALSYYYHDYYIALTGIDLLLITLVLYKETIVSIITREFYTIKQEKADSPLSKQYDHDRDRSFKFDDNNPQVFRLYGEFS